MNFDLVDVFPSERPLTGNPLAVVHGAEALSDQQMITLTRWLGFSETTFLLPPTDPGADYHVRIFCPRGELPFAGHPTLGTAWAWLNAGGKPVREGVVMQQCGVGLVEVRVTGEKLAFRAPPLIRSGPLEEAELAEALKLLKLPREAVLDAVWADNGPGWQLLRLASAEAVLAVECPARGPVPMDLALVGPSREFGIDWEVRTFFTGETGAVVEDPVTGSLNASLGQYLFETGLATEAYVAAQGRCVGADGRAYVSREGDDVWVGGRVAAVSLGAR
ncbi:PhzF family phenazine biosynthesis protein [Novosphingobium terrae]|uniref:PhzF family phenazine biosynthesis protein n=1 Tax=Novosphingobium terrae TaxID=2726189 RepID=UPI00197F89E4|nr:PhzF family phenazine biosynthesis protein [Novosphingobium terrae]